MRQLLYSVKFMHDHGISHRDLKLENIMLKRNKHSGAFDDVRIIDFGLSKQFNPADE